MLAKKHGGDGWALCGNVHVLCFLDFPIHRNRLKNTKIVCQFVQVFGHFQAFFDTISFQKSGIEREGESL